MSPPGDARHRPPPPHSRRARRRRRRHERLFDKWLATAGESSASAEPTRPPVEPAGLPEPVPAVPAAELDGAGAPAPDPLHDAIHAAVHAAMADVFRDRPPPPPADPFEERQPEPAGATLTLTETAPRAADTGDPAAEAHAAADETPPGAPKHRSPLRNTVEWVLIIGAALVAAVVIKTFLIQAFYIPSPSMEPTLEIQDRVLVNKLSYRLHDVHRGDVVVFERPPNDVGQIKDLIKRVVALPGETVEAHDGTVLVNGRVLREPYLPSGTVTGEFGPVRVPPDHVWVMGDNRGNSSDSRVFGAIDEESIIGRAFVRVWPVTALGLL